MPFFLQNVKICNFCRETLTYDVFGPNNLGIRARRILLLVFFRLEKRPHFNYACSVDRQPRMDFQMFIYGVIFNLIQISHKILNKSRKCAGRAKLGKVEIVCPEQKLFIQPVHPIKFARVDVGKKRVESIEGSRKYPEEW